MNPGKHQSSKQRGQDGGWKVHDCAHLCFPLFFFTHTLCMNYVIAIFLLVSCMNTRNLLSYFHEFCQVLCTINPPKSEQTEPRAKNFAGFYNHFALLTMV